MGNSAVRSLNGMWKSREISTPTKVQLLKALVWSIASYGCEGWTPRKQDQRRIEAFEMWCYRRPLRVSWTQRKTNEWVLLELGEKRQLLKDIKTRKIRYYEHVMRKDSCLEKDIIQGHVNGRRSPGRQRRRWVEDITEWTGLQINEAVRVTEDRQRWHNVLHTANPLGGRL